MMVMMTMLMSITFIVIMKNIMISLLAIISVMMRIKLY